MEWSEFLDVLTLDKILHEEEWMCKLKKKKEQYKMSDYGGQCYSVAH